MEVNSVSDGSIPTSINESIAVNGLQPQEIIFQESFNDSDLDQAFIVPSYRRSIW